MTGRLTSFGRDWVEWIDKVSSVRFLANTECLMMSLSCLTKDRT